MSKISYQITSLLKETFYRIDFLFDNFARNTNTRFTIIIVSIFVSFFILFGLILWSQNKNYQIINNLVGMNNTYVQQINHLNNEQKSNKVFESEKDIIDNICSNNYIDPVYRRVCDQRKFFK